MKTKIVLIMFYSIFGIWQNIFAQEPDTLILGTNIDSSFIVNADTILIESDSILVFNADTTLIVDKNQKTIQQLDSLDLIYQIKKSELQSINEKIDSLKLLLSNENRIDSISTSNDLNKEEFLILDYNFEFTVVSCEIYRNELKVILNFKNLKGFETVLNMKIDGYENKISKQTQKGMIPLIKSFVPETEDDNLILTIILDKDRLRIEKNGIIKIELWMQLNNHPKSGKYKPFNKIEWDKLSRKYI